MQEQLRALRQTPKTETKIRNENKKRGGKVEMYLHA